MGRSQELRRLRQGLRTTCAALIYGMGGIGKTALGVTLAKEWEGPTVYCRATSAPPAVMLDDLRRQLGQGSAFEAPSDAARIHDLARYLEANHAIFLCDDLHLLPPDSQILLVEMLSTSLRTARFLATSRVRLPVRGDGPDRLELKLDPIDERDAQKLWSSLDSLYGPVRGFSRALASCGGNPLALRQAHAGGDLTSEVSDPLAGSLADLTPDESHLALALALARIHLPGTVLEQMLPQDRVREALRGLYRRMLVEIDGAGICSLHDLIRDRLLCEAGPRDLRGLHQALARHMMSAPLDAAIRSREVAYHWGQAEQAEQAGHFLVSQAATLVRQGATEELLAGLEAIAPGHRTYDMELQIGRCLVRLNAIHRGYRLLSALRSSQEAPSIDLQLAFSQAALLAGRLRQADSALKAVLSHEECSARQRSRATLMTANLMILQGRFREARHCIEQGERSVEAPNDRAKFAIMTAFSYWIEGRHQRAGDASLVVRQLLASSPLPHTRWKLYVTLAALDVNMGRLSDSEATLRRVGGGLEEDDALVPISLRVERALLLAFKGEHLLAIRKLRSAHALYRDIGLRLAEWWAGLLLGRNLLLLGQVNEGTAILESTKQQAEEAGAFGVAQAVDYHWGVDPLRMLENKVEREIRSKVGLQARMQTLSALRYASAGHTATVQTVVQRCRSEIGSRPGYGLDRALCLLAEAVCARTHGDADQYGILVESARVEAARDEVDPDLIARLLDRLAALEVVRNDGVVELSEQPPVSCTGTCVVDAGTHTVRTDTQTITLSTRPVIRRLLYALAGRAGERVSNDAIVRYVWDSEYDPRRHHSSIRVSIRRLRMLLEKTPLKVESEEAGYRLCVPLGFLFSKHAQ